MLDNLQHESCRYYKYQDSYNSKWPPYFIQDGRHNWHCYAKFAKMHISVIMSPYIVYEYVLFDNLKSLAYIVHVYLVHNCVFLCTL